MDCTDEFQSFTTGRYKLRPVSLGLRQNADPRSTDPLLTPPPPPLLTRLKFTGNNNEIKLYIKVDLPNEEIIFKYCTECIYAYIARISQAINFHMRYIVCTFIERHFTKKNTSEVLTGKKSIERGKYFTILTINIFTETLKNYWFVYFYAQT